MQVADTKSLCRMVSVVVQKGQHHNVPKVTRVKKYTNRPQPYETAATPRTGLRIFYSLCQVI